MKFFKLVFDLGKPGTCKQLQNYKLAGVTGISASGTVIYEFLGVARDAVLVMPAKSVLAINKLIEIKYDDPESLLANNMYLAKRIFNKLGSSSNQDVLYNLYEYLFASLVRLHILDKWYIQAYAPHQKLSWTKAAKSSRINNTDDFINVLLQGIKELKKNHKDWYYHSALETLLQVHRNTLRKFVKMMAEQVNRVYGSEKEWVVPGRVLRIPKNSTLIVLLPGKLKNKEDLVRYIKEKQNDKLQQMFGGADYIVQFARKLLRCRLHKYYKVKYVSRDKLDTVMRIRYNKYRSRKR